MVSYDSIFVPLSAALGLSITLERILEIAKNIMHRLIGNKKGKRIPPDYTFEEQLAELENAYRREKRAREMEKLIEQRKKERKELLDSLKKERKKKKPDVRRIKWIKTQLKELETDVEVDEEFYKETVLVEPANDPDDGKTMKRFLIQMFGFAAGIVAAHYSGIQLFNSFLTALGQPEMPANLDFLLTGLLIGGGSGPMHVLVEFISQRNIVMVKEEKENTPEGREATSEQKHVSRSTLIPKESEYWLEISYNGGIDRELLEYVHQRKKEPEIIVFHHTALPQTTEFEDIVRFIKNKRDSQGNRWLTGYHCIVMPDGRVYSFCRWDRYGNHTAGANLNSLGIAMHGNFEIDPHVPFSNADGSFGDQRPSEIQLRNAARVVLLWSHLYEIDINFKKKILPHNHFVDKSCPGSGFPYPEFQKWIEFYADKWEKSSFIKEKIAEFKLKPYIYGTVSTEAHS